MTTTKKDKPTVDQARARVLCDFSLNGTPLYIGDVVAAPRNLLNHENLDAHPSAVEYAVENGAVVKQVESIDDLI